MPVSLRESFNTVRRRSRAVRNPWGLLDLDLLVADFHCSLLPFAAAAHSLPPLQLGTGKHLSRMPITSQSVSIK
jgi:hypothetical protein